MKVPESFPFLPRNRSAPHSQNKRSTPAKNEKVKFFIAIQFDFIIRFYNVPFQNETQSYSRNFIGLVHDLMRQTCGDLRRFPTRILWFSNISPLCSPLPAFQSNQNKTKQKKKTFKKRSLRKRFFCFDCEIIFCFHRVVINGFEPIRVQVLSSRSSRACHVPTQQTNFILARVFILLDYP